MFARRYVLVVVFLLIPVEARAHLHKAGAFFARSYDKGSRLGGFQLGGEHMFPRPLKADKALGKAQRTGWASVFLSTSTNWGPHNGGDRTQFALWGGFRGTWAVPPLGKRFELYGHVTGAFLHTQDSKPERVHSATGGGAALGSPSTCARGSTRSTGKWLPRYSTTGSPSMGGAPTSSCRWA